MHLRVWKFSINKKKKFRKILGAALQAPAGDASARVEVLAPIPAQVLQDVGIPVKAGGQCGIF